MFSLASLSLICVCVYMRIHTSNNNKERWYKEETWRVCLGNSTCYIWCWTILTNHSTCNIHFQYASLLPHLLIFLKRTRLKVLNLQNDAGTLHHVFSCYASIFNLPNVITHTRWWLSSAGQTLSSRKMIWLHNFTWKGNLTQPPNFVHHLLTHDGVSQRCTFSCIDFLVLLNWTWAFTPVV